jgi:hypothetical protein
MYYIKNVETGEMITFADEYSQPVEVWNNPRSWAKSNEREYNIWLEKQQIKDYEDYDKQDQILTNIVKQVSKSRSKTANQDSKTSDELVIQVSNSSSKLVNQDSKSSSDWGGVRKGAGRKKGFKMADEHRKKLSESMKGNSNAKKKEDPDR